MINFEETPFDEVKLFRFDGLTDNRGSKIRYYSADEFSASKIDFVPQEEILYEIPLANTLFGIHFQDEPKPQQKMIRLIAGCGIDYAIDLRPESPTYRKWFSTELSAQNKMQILIPRGFGHLFRSTADNTIMIFQIDCPFDKTLSRIVSYRDPIINLDIKDMNFILAPKDESAPYL
ncbi:MAG: dTDP-4-dehydrorhamnose 3,5-epimerase family protein [Treponema sp.]|nr:dTDP-4-dehydrorhamnose 3,5-epimerase family protein [Treponema sp.]